MGRLVRTVFGMLGVLCVNAMVAAETETASYRGFVVWEGEVRVALNTDVDLVTVAGELKKLVIADANEQFYVAVVRGETSDSALVRHRRTSAVYDAVITEAVPGAHGLVAVLLLLDAQPVGEVTISLDEIIPASPQPFGGGIPGTDIAVSRLGMDGFGSGDDYAYYGEAEGLRAFAIATTSCNVGTSLAEWDAGPSGRHPVIAQNAYRYSNGRFEQIGQSWLKHSFCAVSEPTCGQCQGTGCGTLGIGCADTYWAGLNGDPNSGPRSQINPQGILPGGTGTHVHPFPTPIGPSALRGRLLIANSDIGVFGAKYFVEAHYVTHDEPRENRHNNASHRQIILNPTSMSSGIANPVQMFEPAIMAWAEADPSATVIAADVPDEGRFHVGYSATDNGDGTWHYEYAIHNMNSDRSAAAFSIPTGNGNVLTNVGFHDVDYHSGEIYDSTDWHAAKTGNSIIWSSPQTFDANPNTNALRWGTTYNFRFDAPGEPVMVEAELQLFKPGVPTSISVLVPAPEATVQVAFMRGDVDGDGLFNVLVDAQYLLDFGFLGGPDPTCDHAADADDNGIVNMLVDTLYLLEYGFLSGRAIPSPFPECGPDPTEDPLECDMHGGCP